MDAARAMAWGRSGLALLVVPTLTDDLATGRSAPWVGLGAVGLSALALVFPRGALLAGIGLAAAGLGWGSRVDEDLMTHHRWLLVGLLIAAGALPDPRQLRFAVRAQLAAVYGFGGLDKLLDPAFRSGARLVQIELERDPASVWLDHPPWAALWLAWGVLLWQLAVPLGLFCPRLRALAVATALIFHLVVQLWLPVGTFGLICMVGWWMACVRPAPR